MFLEELEPRNIDENISALRAAFKHTWFDFCDTTSVHGLKYTKDKETNKCIRFLWFIICLTSFICALLMVHNFYVNYESNPTRMNVENEHAPVENIQFPPTTICPEVLFNREKSLQFLQTLIFPKNLNVTYVFDMLDISYGFMYNDEEIELKTLELFDNLLELNKIDTLKFMKSLRWKCEDLLFRCRFNDRIIPCKSIFQTVRTWNGFCCGFNMNQTGLSHFTNQTAYAGLSHGLSLVLYYNDSLYDRVKSFSHGFKVMFQETNAFPSSHSVCKFVPLNEEVFVSVQPTETLSSNGVKEMSLEERGCTYPNEIAIKYFRNYVAANCEMNCLVSKMVKNCGCLTYLFHNNRSNDRVCTYRDIPCLMDNFAIIAGRLRKYQCICYNSCEKVEYTIDASNTPLVINVPTSDKLYKDIKEDYAVLHVFVKSDVYRRIRLDLLANMLTLFSNLGSAFSLFVGISFMSAVEFLYYFTVILKKHYQQECIARENRYIRQQIKQNRIQ